MGSWRRREDKEEEEEEDEDDEARISRLFYLQLYSSVLKAANEERERSEKRRQTVIGGTSASTPARRSHSGRSVRLPRAVRSLSWKDLTNLVSSRRWRGQRGFFFPRETEEQQVDVVFDSSDGANTTAETTMVGDAGRRSDRQRILRGEEPRGTRETNGRQSRALEYQGNDKPKKLEPVLNIRMKELEKKQKEEDENTANSNNIYPGKLRIHGNYVET